MPDPSPTPRRPLAFPSRFEWVQQAFTTLTKNVLALHPLLDLLKNPEGEAAFAEKLLASLAAIERNTTDLQEQLRAAKAEQAATHATITEMARTIESLNEKMDILVDLLGLESNSAGTSSRS